MSENWIVPCSIKFFDVVGHFEKSDSIVWRKVSALKEGDIVYVYIGAPFSEVKYKCKIVNDNVSEEILKNNQYAVKKTDNSRKQKYIEMKLEYTYEDGVLSLEKLREHGLGQTQTQARTDRRLQAFIDSINEGLGI